MMKVAVNVRHAGRPRKIKFGDVVITAPAPQKASVEANIVQSTEMLGRAVKRLSKPGVVVRRRKGIPLFSLDSENPNVVVRVLDGKTERGQLVKGEFKAYA